MEKMTFKTDRTSLVEGEVITVEWDCLDAERVELSIDNGFKASVVPLEKSGTKRFRLNRSKGRTRLTITAWVGGKSFSKTIKVRVHEMPTTHAETVGDDYAQEWPRRQVAGTEDALADGLAGYDTRQEGGLACTYDNSRDTTALHSDAAAIDFRYTRCSGLPCLVYPQEIV